MWYYILHRIEWSKIEISTKGSYQLHHASGNRKMWQVFICSYNVIILIRGGWVFISLKYPWILPRVNITFRPHHQLFWKPLINLMYKYVCLLAPLGKILFKFKISPYTQYCDLFKYTQFLNIFYYFIFVERELPF